MSVNVNPFFTAFLLAWIGRVAKPTYSLSWSCRKVRYQNIVRYIFAFFKILPLKYPKST